MCLDLHAWRRFFNFDLHGSVETMDITVDAETLTMTINLPESSEPPTPPPVPTMPPPAPISTVIPSPTPAHQARSPACKKAKQPSPSTRDGNHTRRKNP